MGILLFELFRNPLFMGILNKWETLVLNKITNETKKTMDARRHHRNYLRRMCDYLLQQ